MKIKKFTEKIKAPEGVQIAVENGTVIVKGPNGELRRRLVDPKIGIAMEGQDLLFSVDIFTKREKKLLGTYRAHIHNMFRGVTESHEYVLKICSGHFPMNAGFSNNEFSVKNFMGEKIPRIQKISENVEIKIDGDIIHVKGIDKELVAQTAASLERLTRRNGFDKRVFQDGIYIVNKDGKEIK